MILSYKKLTEQEDQIRNLLEKGEYPFYVKSIAEKPTKKGTNKMLEVEIGIIDQNEKEFTIKDWIMLDMDEMSWKLRHFAITLNLLDKYENNLLEIKDFVRKSGYVRISVADYEKDGEIRKINRVADYIKPTQEKCVIVQKSIKSNNFIDDDIAF